MLGSYQCAVLDDLIHRYASLDEVRRSDRDGAVLLEIKKGRGLRVEVLIAPEVLEWFAVVRQRDSDEPLVSEWYDYTGYDAKETREEQVAAMADDLDNFLSRLLGSEVRVTEWNGWLRKHRVFETRDSGQWRFEFNNALVRWMNPERGTERVYE